MQTTDELLRWSREALPKLAERLAASRAVLGKALSRLDREGRPRQDEPRPPD